MTFFVCVCLFVGWLVNERYREREKKNLERVQVYQRFGECFFKYFQQT